jgi:hypothetical protein
VFLHRSFFIGGFGGNKSGFGGFGGVNTFPIFPNVQIGNVFFV